MHHFGILIEPLRHEVITIIKDENLAYTKFDVVALLLTQPDQMEIDIHKV